MRHFHAGWSLPGCLPEMEPFITESFTEASRFVNEEQFSQDENTDPYTYWVDSCDETECLEEED